MGDAVSISAAPTALVQDLRIQHVQNVPKTIALSQNAQLTIDSTVFTASNAGQAFRCSGQGMYNETLRACQCFDQATPRDKNCAPLYVNYDVTAAVGTDILDGVYRPLKYADVLKTGMEIAALAPVYDRMVAFRRNDDRYQGTLLAVKHADDRRREPQTPPPQFRGYFWVVHRITQPQGTAGMPLLRSALVSTPHPPPSTTGWYLMDPDHPAESLDMVQALPSYDPSLEATDVRLAAGAVVPQPGPSPPSKGGASSTTVAMAAAIAGAVAFLVTLLLVAERRRRSRQGRRKAGRGGASAGAAAAGRVAGLAEAMSDDDNDDEPLLSEAFDESADIPMLTLAELSSGASELRRALDAIGGRWHAELHLLDAAGFHTLHYLIVKGDAAQLHAYLLERLAAQRLHAASSSVGGASFSNGDSGGSSWGGASPASARHNPSPTSSSSNAGLSPELAHGDTRHAPSFSPPGDASTLQRVSPAYTSFSSMARSSSEDSQDPPPWPSRGYTGTAGASDSGVSGSSPAGSPSGVHSAAAAGVPCALVDFADANGRTPLLWAVTAKQPRCLELLLAAGANPAVCCPTTLETPLHLASLESLGASPDPFDLLLTAKAPLDVKNREGMTPLACASSAGHLGRVCNLLDAGADPLAQDSQGWTALMAATRYGHAAVVRRLVKNKAGLVNVADVAGRSALHWAVSVDEHDVLVALLNSRALDLTQSDHEGNTALHYAALRGVEQPIELIVERRPAKQVLALLIKRNSAHQTAAETALAAGYAALAARLEALYQRVNGQLQDTAGEGHATALSSPHAAPLDGGGSARPGASGDLGRVGHSSALEQKAPPAAGAAAPKRPSGGYSDLDFTAPPPTPPASALAVQSKARAKRTTAQLPAEGPPQKRGADGAASSASEEAGTTRFMGRKEYMKQYRAQQRQLRAGCADEVATLEAENEQCAAMMATLAAEADLLRRMVHQGSSSIDSEA